MLLTYHQQDTLRTQGAFHVQSFQSIIQENYITIYQFFSRCNVTFELNKKTFDHGKSILVFYRIVDSVLTKTFE